MIVNETSIHQISPTESGFSFIKHLKLRFSLIIGFGKTSFWHPTMYVYGEYPLFSPPKGCQNEVFPWFFSKAVI